MKRLIFVLVSLFYIQSTFSQDINVSVSAPPKVGVGQRFEVKYSVKDKQASNIRLENNANFLNISGPSSSFHSTNIVNGVHVTQETTFLYSYILEAKEIGKLNLPVFSATVDGKQITSKTTSIEVQKEPVQTQQNTQRNRGWDPWAEFDDAFWGKSAPQQNTTPQEISSEDIFVRTFVNKTDVYKGEPIIVTLKLFTAVDLASIDDLKFPEFNSFYSQEIEAPQRLNYAREIYNNKTYNTAVIRKYILYPRVAGEIEIETGRYDCQIRQIVGNINMFNPFGSYQTVKKTIHSPAVKINVKNLPVTNFSGFNGAVGNYNTKLTKSADTVNVNDAVTFKLSISGNGNFNMVEAPKISWPNEFEVYDPSLTDNTSVSEVGIAGTKTWEYTIVPRYPGLYKLENIDFSYFDLNSHQYKTHTIDNISLAVRKDANDNKFTELNYTAKRNVEYIGDQDIRFLKNNFSRLKKNYIPIFATNLWWLFYIIPLAIFILIIIILRKTIKANSDITKVKAKKANKISRKRLKKAKVYMQQNQKSEFYKEIISALWGYVSNKLSIPIAELTKSNIELELNNRNVDLDTINNFINTIDKCEFAHFAPTSPETELTYIYKEAVNIIETLEQKIK